MKHPKNYTILLKEIKESLNQLKSILVLELEDSLLLIFPKENCRLNWITKKKKNPSRVFIANDQSDLKICLDMQKTCAFHNNLQLGEQIWSTLPDIKTINLVTKTITWIFISPQTNVNWTQWNRMVSSGIDPQIYNQKILSMVPNKFNGKQKKKYFDPHIISHTKINLRWVIT